MDTMYVSITTPILLLVFVKIFSCSLACRKPTTFSSALLSPFSQLLHFSFLPLTYVVYPIRCQLVVDERKVFLSSSLISFVILSFL